MKIPFDPLKVAGFGRKVKKPPRVDPKYATFNRRATAVTIDSLVMLLFAPIIDTAFNHFYPHASFDRAALSEQINQDPNLWLPLFLTAVTQSGTLARFLWSTGIQTIILFLLSGVCWHYWAATPGKMICRIKIVDANTGAPISDRQTIIRLLGYLVSTAFLLCGFFWIRFDKRRQGWHDKMAGTVVVKSRSA